MTLGFSCLNRTTDKSGAFLSKDPGNGHSEPGGHITLYICILKLYDFILHAHSFNGFQTHVKPSHEE